MKDRAQQEHRCFGHDSALPEKSSIADTVSLLSAVAHPVRLLALIALRRRGPLPAGELQTITDTEQSHLSHQLRVLREARLVKTERDGKRVIYQLYDEHVAHIVEDALKHAVSDDCLDGRQGGEG